MSDDALDTIVIEKEKLGTLLNNIDKRCKRIEDRINKIEVFSKEIKTDNEWQQKRTTLKADNTEMLAMRNQE